MNDDKGFGKCYDIIKIVFTEHAMFNESYARSSQKPFFTMFPKMSLTFKGFSKAS